MIRFLFIIGVGLLPLSEAVALYRCLDLFRNETPVNPTEVFNEAGLRLMRPLQEPFFRPHHSSVVRPHLKTGVDKSLAIVAPRNSVESLHQGEWAERFHIQKRGYTEEQAKVAREEGTRYTELHTLTLRVALGRPNWGVYGLILGDRYYFLDLSSMVNPEALDQFVNVYQQRGVGTGSYVFTKPFAINGQVSDFFYDTLAPSGSFYGILIGRANGVDVVRVDTPTLASQEHVQGTWEYDGQDLILRIFLYSK